MQKITEFEKEILNTIDNIYQLANYRLLKARALIRYPFFIYFHLLHPFHIMACDLPKLQLLFQYLTKHNIERAINGHELFQRFKQRLISKNISMSEPEKGEPLVSYPPQPGIVFKDFERIVNLINGDVRFFINFF